MIVLIGSEKGGTGKTTLATNLAAMRALAGKDTLLVDTDPQGSASTWAQVRADEEVAPRVTCVTKTGKVGYDLVDLKPKFDTIIVDAGGRDSTELRQSMAVCDLMIIPIRPSQFDTWATAHMDQLLRQIEQQMGAIPRARTLFNATSANLVSKEVAEASELIDTEYANTMPTMATKIVDRIAFRKAAREGRSVVELAAAVRDPKAVAEMSALYKEIFNESYRQKHA